MPEAGARGRTLTPEHKAKMAEGRARSNAERKAHKPAKAPRISAPRAEQAPKRGSGILPDKVRRRVVALVERLVGVLDGSAVWTAKRLTKATYKEEMNAAGEVVLVETGRQRAVSDATIEIDRLEEWEKKWLAEELTDELIRYPRIRGFLLKMIEFEDRSSLPMCVTVLALPRLAHHGLIPPEFTAMVDEMREAARRAHRGKAREVAPEPEPEIAPEPIAAAAD